MKKYIYGAILLFIIYSFMKPSSIDLAIDNPSDRAITVSVDELHVEVPPKEVVWVEMGEGEHTVTLEDGTTHPYNYDSGAFFLNPTKSEYLVTESFFGDESANLSYRLSNPGKTVEFMGMELEGNYDVVKDLVSKVTWSVGAREAMPNSVEADSDQNYVIVKKLMDENEFAQEMIEAIRSMPAEEAPEEAN